MRVWFAAFVLLFATIELFEWVMQLGSWQPTGTWLVLGGMGLAAISNVSHWSLGQPNPDQTRTDQTKIDQMKLDQTDAQQKETAPEQSGAQIAESNSLRMTDSLAAQSDQDSISFKVRPLKR